MFAITISDDTNIQDVLCLQPDICFPLDDRLVLDFLLNVYLIVILYLIFQFQFEIDCYIFG